MSLNRKFVINNLFYYSPTIGISESIVTIAQSHTFKYGHSCFI